MASYSQSPAAFHDADKGMNPLHCGSDTVDTRIWKSGFESRMTFGCGFGEMIGVSGGKGKDLDTCYSATYITYMTSTAALYNLGSGS